MKNKIKEFMEGAEKFAEWLHDSYEEISKEENWKTQEKCQVKFSELPEENKIVMTKLAVRIKEEIIDIIIKEKDSEINKLNDKHLGEILSISGIDNWEKIMRIKSWDLLLIKEKDKLLKSFQKKINTLAKKYSLYDGNNFVQLKTAFKKFLK